MRGYKVQMAESQPRAGVPVSQVSGDDAALSPRSQEYDPIRAVPDQPPAPSEDPVDKEEEEPPKQDDPLFNARSCTDWYCSLIFLLFFLMLWCLSGWSFQEGFPGRLTRGWDYEGHVCGYGGLEDREYTFFPFPNEALEITLCLPGCPQIGTYESLCLYNSTDGTELMDKGCLDSYASKPFFNKYCLPADPGLRAPVLDRLYDKDYVLTRVAGDLFRAWDLCAVIAVIVGGCWVAYFIFFCIGGVMPNLILFLLNICALLLYFIVLPFMIDEESQRVDGKICDHFLRVEMGGDDCDEGDIADGYSYLAYVIGAVFFVLFLILPCLALRVKRGAQALSASAAVHGHSFTLCFCVFLALFVGAGFYAYFITLIVYQVSTGDHETKDVNAVFPASEVERWEFYNGPRVLVIFDVAMILWHFSFFAHLVEYITGSAAAHWFIHNGPKGQFPLHRAIVQVFRYHLGTVFLASVLIPFSRLPRILLSGFRSIVRYISKQPKAEFVSYDPCFKYMTSDALAYTAHTGLNFFDSARQACTLISRHEHRQARQRLNDAETIIWLYQLALILLGPVLMAFWVEHKDITFQGYNMKDVTSALAMMFYMMFFSWYLAQVFSCFVRGLVHGAMIGYLLHEEDRDPNKPPHDPNFDRFMQDQPKEADKPEEEAVPEAPVSGPNQEEAKPLNS